MENNDIKSRRLLACLGDPSRFKLVATLLAGGRCVSDLAAGIGLSQSCTTRHLQALEREGLVSGSREGKRVIFNLRLDEPGIAGLIAWARELGLPDGIQLEAVPTESERTGLDEDSLSKVGSNSSGRDRLRRRSGRRQLQVEIEVPPPDSPNADASNPPARVARSEIEDFLL